MKHQKALSVIAILLLVSVCKGPGIRNADIARPSVIRELKQVRIWYTEYQVDRTIRTRIGDITIYQDYSMRVHTERPPLDKIITECYNRLTAAGSVTVRYETLERGAVITRGEIVTRDNPYYLNGLLQNLEKDVNLLKNQNRIDLNEKVVLEYY